MNPTLLPDAPRAAAILRQRAARLASERDPRDKTAPGELFLAVRLGARERYGIPYRWLDEVTRPRGVTVVPGTPAFVAGVTARHGRLVAVLDLARLLGLETGETDAQGPVVMVNAARLRVGLRVDEVIGNDRYVANALAPLPREAAARAPWMTGIHAGQLTMLDLDALLGAQHPHIKEHA